MVSSKECAGKTESFANQINVKRQSDVVENRSHVKFLTSVVSDLVHQGLVFRGEDKNHQIKEILPNYSK